MRSCPSHTAAGMLMIVLAAPRFAEPSKTPGPRESKPPATQPAIESTLKVASSVDGVRFEPTGDVLLTHAAHPTLVRLPRGDLLAVFEYAGPAEGGASPGKSGTLAKPGLWATRSNDDGKTWMSPRPIRLSGVPENARVSHPGLVLLAGGRVQLFFCVTPDGASRRQREREPACIMSATSRNGATYQVETRAAVACPDLESVRASAFWATRDLVLLAAEERSAQAASGKLLVRQFLSSDGRSFGRPERARFAGEIGHVLQIDEHRWRMFVNGDGDIRSRVSHDGIRWRDEPDVCLHGGSDAAVAPAGEDRFLMLYAATADPKDRNAPQLLASSTTGSGTAPGQNGPTGSSPKGSGASSSLAWDNFDGSGLEAGLGGPGDGFSAEAGADAPYPDFVNHFDYLGWIEQNLLPPADQNAYFAYGDLHEVVKDLGAEAFKDMLNGDDHIGPPGPWSPAEHPDWEATYQQTQDLIAKFREGAASSLPYAYPMQWTEGTEPDDRLLVNIVLPSLAGFRRMTKAVLSQAWRAPDGTVSPDTMRDALDMCLGNARQLSTGATLIERLVGCAERNLVEEHARWALRNDVFSSAEEIETTLNLLNEKDLPISDLTGWTKMERLWVKDAAQYAFKPGENGEPARLDPERVKKIAAIMDSTTPENVDVPPEILELTPAQISESLANIDAYYRHMEEVWQASYPGPAIENTDKLAQELNDRDPIAGKVLASGHRAYEMMLRMEANRRATRLVYGVELYRARNGRYPSSIDELPAEHAADVRTDPFSGADFVYRLDDDGPVIYSASNNGVDNGGLHSRNWGDREDGTGSDDYVFWPPQ